MIIPDMHNKRIGVLGLGVTGTSFLKVIKDHTNHLVVWDDDPAKRAMLPSEYAHCLAIPIENSWLGLDYLFVSPGINLLKTKEHLVLLKAREDGVKIISDIDVFFENHYGGIYIGVTGTNGKSTVVKLIEHILRQFKSEVYAVGNIGEPILNYLDKTELGTHFIVETSSFQLDLLQKNHFNISVLLNISPDHLDRYPNFEAYIKSKERILHSNKYTNVGVINIDDKHCLNMYEKYKDNKKYNFLPISVEEKLDKGLSIQDNIIYNNTGFTQLDQIELPDLPNLPGAHNKINLLAALAVCLVEGADLTECLEAAQSFRGLEHRMQYVDSINNIDFINDSKATNIDAAKRSLGAFENIYWLAGGKSKDEDLEEFAGSFENVKKAYVYGYSKDKLQEFLNKHEVECEAYNTLDEAFGAALRETGMNQLQFQDKCTILLAPAYASFDQFESFEKRGDRFIELVNLIKGKQAS